MNHFSLQNFGKLSVTVAERSRRNAEPVQEGGVEVAHWLAFHLQVAAVFQPEVLSARQQ